MLKQPSTRFEGDPAGGDNRAAEGAASNDRSASDGLGSEIFDSYLTSFYALRNDLSPAALEKARRDGGRDFEAHLPEDKTAPILEIGCGCGGFLLYCEAAGFADVHGVDISRQQVEFCRRQGLNNVTLADGLAYLTEHDDEYETVVLSDVLEHLPKRRALALLKEIYLHLRPGGKVIARVPNLSNPLNLRTRYVDFTHELGFTTESLEQILRLTGFEIMEISGIFSLHRNPIARLIFDILLWKAFVLLSRHTLRLQAIPLRGKNLLGVGRKPDERKTQLPSRDGDSPGG